MCILKYAFKGSLSENGTWQRITHSETWATASPKKLGKMPILVDTHFLPTLSKNFGFGYQNTRWVNPPTP